MNNLLIIISLILLFFFVYLFTMFFVLNPKELKIKYKGIKSVYKKSDSIYKYEIITDKGILNLKLNSVGRYKFDKYYNIFKFSKKNTEFDILVYGFKKINIIYINTILSKKQDNIKI